MKVIIVDVYKGFVNKVTGLSDNEQLVVRDYDTEGIELSSLKTDKNGNLYFEETWNLQNYDN